eukprot:CAMPEP_0196139592 /NCGR_PEP_ID=MMETSP0910-20130528/6816_1 /TAXON_ID=49265 /ORGANISM="Thalassiosira rotula, Strain GSO102" /LENGTH=50 /DNA_ID=CAMNT_0041400337 /DNA_START=121 /DNA_END=270 /DNA_ORIENTATION=-
MKFVAPSVLRWAVNPVPTSYNVSSTSKITVLIVGRLRRMPLLDSSSLIAV